MLRKTVLYFLMALSYIIPKTYYMSLHKILGTELGRAHLFFKYPQEVRTSYTTQRVRFSPYVANTPRRRRLSHRRRQKSLAEHSLAPNPVVFASKLGYVSQNHAEKSTLPFNYQVIVYGVVFAELNLTPPFRQPRCDSGNAYLFNFFGNPKTRCAGRSVRLYMYARPAAIGRVWGLSAYTFRSTRPSTRDVRLARSRS